MRIGILFIALLLAGCSGDGKPGLRGRMTFDGKPMAGYQLALMPSGGPFTTSGGAVISSDGDFEVRRIGAGEYVVCVQRFTGPTPPGARPVEPTPPSIPDHYRNPQETPLRVQIAADRMTEQDFELTGE